MIVVDENDNTYLVERAIPPQIGGWCSFGGYNGFGEHPFSTIVHESSDEGNASIDGLPAVQLGQWVESEGVVMVTYYLVRAHSSRIGRFSANKEASARRKVNLFTYNVAELAFNANRLAFLAARAYITAERRATRRRHLSQVAVVLSIIGAFIAGAILF